jgi:23S rRNA (guanosine2251-2'-O)-methyltransferase
VEGKQNQLVFGIRAVIEAVEAGKEIESLYVQKGIAGDLFRELKTLVEANDIRMQMVPVEKLNAYISPISFYKVEDIIPFVFEKGEVPLILMLDRITDVRNFGAIARTAECAGVHAIIVPMRESAAISGDAIKTSAGALFNIPVCRVNNLKTAVQYLQESGLQVVACSEKNDQTIYEIDYTMPTAIVMGSEEDGISNDIIRIADQYAKIPLKGGIASLNVSVATGVILYEAVRQRG